MQINIDLWIWDDDPIFMDIFFIDSNGIQILEVLMTLDFVVSGLFLYVFLWMPKGFT